MSILLAFNSSHTTSLIIYINLLNPCLVCVFVQFSLACFQKSKNVFTRSDTITELGQVFNWLPRSADKHLYSFNFYWKKLKAAFLIFKCLQGTRIPAFLSYVEKISHNYKTRNNANLYLPLVRIEAARKSFLFQAPRCFNELLLEIHSLLFLLIKTKREI